MHKSLHWHPENSLCFLLVLGSHLSDLMPSPFLVSSHFRQAYLITSRKDYRFWSIFLRFYVVYNCSYSDITFDWSLAWYKNNRCKIFVPKILKPFSFCIQLLWSMMLFCYLTFWFWTAFLLFCCFLGLKLLGISLCPQCSEILHWCALSWIVYCEINCEIISKPFLSGDSYTSALVYFLKHFPWWFSWYSVLHFWSSSNMDIKPTW